MGIMMKRLARNSGRFIASVGVLMALSFYTPAQNRELLNRNESPSAAGATTRVEPQERRGEEAREDRNPLRLALLKQPSAAPVAAGPASSPTGQATGANGKG